MFENFDGILIVGVPIYCLLLMTTGWRAVARVRSLQNIPKLLCVFGAIMFCISDFLIAFDKFYTPIRNAQAYVMATYYMAQFGLAMSTIDHEVLLEKSSSKSK